MARKRTTVTQTSNLALVRWLLCISEKTYKAMQQTKQHGTWQPIALAACNYQFSDGKLRNRKLCNRKQRTFD
jgi:hypothetical protein